MKKKLITEFIYLNLLKILITSYLNILKLLITSFKNTNNIMPLKCHGMIHNSYFWDKMYIGCRRRNRITGFINLILLKILITYLNLLKLLITSFKNLVNNIS